MKHSVLFALALLAIPASLAAQDQATADAVYLRAKRMVSDGNGEAGRAIVDSMMARAAPRSPELAEALFWRASLSAEASAAENDYRRVVIEHPLNFRAGDALLRLAQLEIARGNQDVALVHLRRIALEHPGGSNLALASYWTARALFEKNDVRAACSAVADARVSAPVTDIELRNQIDSHSQQCGIAPRPPEPLSTGKIPVTTTISGPFSVQVAAFNTAREANATVAKLVSQGHSARVDGDAKPYRVRIGRHATAMEAAAAQRQLKSKGHTGFVVRTDGK